MRVTETHFYWLADSLSQLVWTVDATGRLGYCNPAWYEFTGIGEGAQFLEGYLEALHPEDRPLWRHKWEQALTSGKPYTVERRVRFQADQNYVRQLEHGCPILDSTGRTVESLLIARDVDEDKDLVAQLRHSIESKDKFFAFISHEMRDPLATISSTLDLVLQRIDEPVVVNQSCARMTRPVAQLVRLVDDVFDLIRSQNAQIHLRRDSIDLEGALTSAIEACQPIIASREHNLTVAMPLNSAIVDGDAGRLTQVFVNLLVNAAKFTDKGGQIHVSVERDADWVLIKIRDSGIGIPREKLMHVFDAYAHAGGGSGTSQGGLGLGLTLARHLIKLHGGTVNAYSQGAGHGSEFVVRLPVSRGEGFPVRFLPKTGSSSALT